MGKNGKLAKKSSCKKKERNLPISPRARKKKETYKKVVDQEKRKKRKKFNLDLDLDFVNPSIDIDI